MPPKKKKAAPKKQIVFATTSIPKKAEPAPEAAPAVTPYKGEGEGTSSEDGSPSQQSDGKQDAGAHEEWTPEKQEERELQMLAERVRPVCEKELAKQMKIIDFEKRFAKTLPKFGWDDLRFQDEVLELAQMETREMPKYKMAEDEESALQHVVILYAVLERLGFRRARILECLRAISNFDLDEAMNWAFLNCSTEEISQLDSAEASGATDSSPDASLAPSAADTTGSTTPIGTALATSANIDDLPSDLAKKMKPLQRAPIATVEEATAEYVALKLEMADLAKKIPAPGSNMKGKALKDAATYRKQLKFVEDKVKMLQAGYNFEQRLADEALQAKLDEIAATEAPSPATEPPELINGSADEDASGAAPRELVEELQPSLVEKETASADPIHVSAAEDGSDEEGGMFGDLLEEMPTQETGEGNTIITVRDLPLPKQFSSKTPRALLEDAVRRQDKYAKTRFSIISSTRAVRASVDIRWQGGKVDVYRMEHEACYDDNQACNYVATMALFGIAPAPTNRMLPAGFRDLWEDFEAARKAKDDQGYTEHLKELLPIVRDRLLVELTATKLPKAPSAVAGNDDLEPRIFSTPSSAQAVQRDIYSRQQSSAYQTMLAQRLNLPIAAHREAILSTIRDNQVTVLCGETGCGKSTQVPSYLLEYEMQSGKQVKIYCTEPRRISAISLAIRVSQELGEAPGSIGRNNSLVGYNIRLEAKVSSSTRLTFATTGIVLRMLEGAGDLDEVTHLIVDEVHERSIDSDFLLIALKTILERRPELRVVLMSATVDAEKLSAYMGGCPVLQVPGRTFPVSSFFLEDVIEMTGYSLDANSDSPYLTRFNKRRSPQLRSEEDAPQLDDDEKDDKAAVVLAQTYSKRTRTTLDVVDEHTINLDLLMLLLEHICSQNADLAARFSHAILIFMPSLETIRKVVDILESHPIFGSAGFQVFPLHSTISSENQSLVFLPPPPGVRKIIVSTNIAETGITIPDVTCVIDSGKHREMRYDEKRQISRLVETFIARSNATQRKGRAGRVQEGICFHLFTKFRMETSFAENPLPEMLRLSLQDLALRIKIMHLGDSIEGTLVKALDPPTVTNISRAIQSLVEVKALTTSEEITQLGRHLAKLPMDVHMGKLLILGCLFGCLSPALTVAAAVNSKSPFITPFGREAEANAIKRSFKVDNSDFLTIDKVHNLWRDSVKAGGHLQFCRKNFISHQNLTQIEDLRGQFFGFLVDTGFVDRAAVNKTGHPGRGRVRFCTIPDSYDINARDHKLVMACIAAAMYPKLLILDNARQWRTLSNSAPAAIHPSSVNFTPGRRPDFDDARYIAYFNIMQSKKLYVWESGSVDEKAVLLLCGEADFKLPSQSLSIDRKIRHRMGPKSTITLKMLRRHYHQIFNQKMRFPSRPLTETQQRWWDLLLDAVGEGGEARSRLVKEQEEQRAEQRPSVKVTLAPASARENAPPSFA